MDIEFSSRPKRFKTTGTMERKAGSGRPVTATIEENGDLVEEFVFPKRT